MVIRTIFSAHLLLLCFLLFELGCGGSGGTQGGGSSQPPNPSPTLSKVTPNSATADSGTLTLSVSGTGFISSSVVEWNGAALSTIYVSSTSLTAQLPASDLTSAGSGNVTVKSPTPGGGTSNTLVFTISSVSTNLSVVDLEGEDIAWNPGQQKLYIAVPSSSSRNPGTITIVDPTTASIVGT